MLLALRVRIFVFWTLYYKMEEEESAPSASNVESEAVRFFVPFFLTHLKQVRLDRQGASMHADFPAEVNAAVAFS